MNETRQGERLTWFAFLTAATALVCWSALAAPEYVEACCHEDGPVENLTFLCYAAAGLGFVCLTRGARVARWYAIAVGGLCLLVAGEEISWGQRLIGWSTPEAVGRINVQAETNLHNLEGVVSVVRLLAVGVVLSVFVLVPWLSRHFRGIGRLGLATPAAIDVATALLAVAVMAGPRLLGAGAIFEVDEWAEFLLGLAFLRFALHAMSPMQREAFATLPKENPT